MTEPFTSYVVTVDVPAEPDIGAVVLDANGSAWQRTQHWAPAVSSWVRPATSMAPDRDTVCDWGALLVRHGPLTVVHPGRVEVVS